MTLNTTPTIMEIDTGATVSIISTHQIDLLKENAHQLGMETNNLPVLRTYSGENMQPQGHVHLQVGYNDKTYQLPSLVVKGTGPNLLGRDWLEHLKLDWIYIHRVDSEDFATMFPDLFSSGLGKLKDVEARLVIEENVTPQYFKPRPVPLSMRVKVEDE